MMTGGKKAAIIGAGNVGAACAYTFLVSGLFSEIIITDINQKKAEGEAMDISHAMPLCPPAKVYAGSYEDLTGSDLVVITAGAPQEKGETRLDLSARNFRIFQDIIPKIAKNAPNSILLVVTNPVDVLTYAAWRLSGFEKSRVLGSGTVLDTSRLRYLLSEHTRISPGNIHTFVVGEHGDSETALFSLTRIAGKSMASYCQDCRLCRGSLDDLAKTRLLKEVREAAYEVIDRKGNTCYGIAQAVLRIARSILRDEDAVLTVSCVLGGEYGQENIAMSVPAIVSSEGAERIVELDLDEKEALGFSQSARAIAGAIESLPFSQ